MVSLNLGCGDDIMGDVRIDCNPSKAAVNLIADAHNLPLKDKIISETLCKSVLEHVKSPFNALLEMKRVTSGHIVIWVPNIMNKKKIERTLRNPLYPINNETTHLQAWDSETIRHLAYFVGLKVLSVEWYDRRSRGSICMPMLASHMRTILFESYKEKHRCKS